MGDEFYGPWYESMIKVGWLRTCYDRLPSNGQFVAPASRLAAVIDTSPTARRGLTSFGTSAVNPRSMLDEAYWKRARPRPGACDYDLTVTFGEAESDWAERYTYLCTGESGGTSDETRRNELFAHRTKRIAPHSVVADVWKRLILTEYVRQPLVRWCDPPLCHTDRPPPDSVVAQLTKTWNILLDTLAPICWLEQAEPSTAPLEYTKLWIHEADASLALQPPELDGGGGTAHPSTPNPSPPPHQLQTQTQPNDPFDDFFSSKSPQPLLQSAASSHASTAAPAFVFSWISSAQQQRLYLRRYQHQNTKQRARAVDDAWIMFGGK